MTFSSPYQTRSAVLFIIFNRLDTSLRVLEEIRHAKPARLYLTADGPRLHKEGEDVKCAETKAAILKSIDWDCEVKTLFRNENLGPKEAVSAAISWFFDHEEEGIVLEHDCLPAKSFFWFCDELLEKYRHDTRIWLISGSNLLKGKKWGEGSYYTSRLTNGWGWASWRRSWNQYDKDLEQYNTREVKAQLQKIFDNPFYVDTWTDIFKRTKAGEIDTWDYQAGFSQFFTNSMNIIPNNNLISNVGFGELAENTVNASSPFASIPLEEFTEMIHPKYMVPEKEADEMVMNIEFADLAIQYKKHHSTRRKIKRGVKSLLKGEDKV